MEQPKLYKGNIFVDDRGVLSFNNDFNEFDKIKRFYTVRNFDKGFIRAWHGHKYESKYVNVIKGSIILCIVNLENNEIKHRVILSDKTPSIYYIPPGYANGFKTLEDDTIINFYSNSSIEESKGDDIRFEYNNLNWDNLFKIEYR